MPVIGRQTCLPDECKPVPVQKHDSRVELLVELGSPIKRSVNKIHYSPGIKITGVFLEVHVRINASSLVTV